MGVLQISELKPGQRLLFTDVLRRRLIGRVRCPAPDHTFMVVETNRGVHLVTAFDVVAII